MVKNLKYLSGKIELNIKAVGGIVVALNCSNNFYCVVPVYDNRGELDMQRSRVYIDIGVWHTSEIIHDNKGVPKNWWREISGEKKTSVLERALEEYSGKLKVK